MRLQTQKEREGGGGDGGRKHYQKINICQQYYEG